MNRSLAYRVSKYIESILGRSRNMNIRIAFFCLVREDFFVW